MPPIEQQRSNFIVQTCEARAKQGEILLFCPKGKSRQTPFETGDPFGLRRAILPVFERTTDGNLIGMGTAVHLDGWGGCLTAEHVIEFLRNDLPQRGLSGQQKHTLNPTTRSHAIALLGIGLVYGQVAVPDWVFAPITDTLAVTREVDDPFAELQGRRRFEMAIDIASFQAAIPDAAYEGRDSPQAMPLQLEGWAPTVGEQVLAFGYPELKPSAVVSETALQLMIEDGLFGAYGTITRVFRFGRDHTNPTPVFEVSAHWPSGMSGGPVVNAAGNVVGLVSRSLAPDGEHDGVGYAACLPWISELAHLVPRVDRLNPGSRVGYGVFRGDPQLLIGVWPSHQLAMEHAVRLGPSYAVHACTHKIGTDEYICIA